GGFGKFSQVIEEPLHGLCVHVAASEQAIDSLIGQLGIIRMQIFSQVLKFGRLWHSFPRPIFGTSSACKCCINCELSFSCQVSSLDRCKNSFISPKRSLAKL